MATQELKDDINALQNVLLIGIPHDAITHEEIVYALHVLAKYQIQTLTSTGATHGNTEIKTHQG